MLMVEDELRSAGLKVTPQRTMILRYISENAGQHFTADQIHRHIIKSISNVPPATVYNILRILVEKKIINSFEVDGKAIYESRTALHINFICESCGIITDHDLGDLEEKLYTHITGKVISSSIVVHGICDACLARVKDSS